MTIKCPKCDSENPDTKPFCADCGTQLIPAPSSPTKNLQTPQISSGKIIASKYKILEELGRGGMGIVYKAKDQKLKRTVALKFLPQELILDEKAKERFIQEAQAAAALNHPQITTIYEIDEAEEKTFIALEYIKGQSLKDKLDSGPIPIDEAKDIVIQVAEGLKEAHDKGMKIWSVIGLTRQAKKLAGNGVDVIVAQGTEAGGHTGRIGTMPLVTSVLNTISPKHVLAAGGIADGRGLAAALAMGAAGAWIGTAFVPTEEAGLEAIETGIMSQWEVETWKQKILNATEDDTKISRVLSGKTLRMIKNKFQQTWEQEEGPILKHPSHNVFVADIEEGIRQNEMEDFAVPVGGQISGIINKIKPAAEVVNEIVEQATHLLEKFAFTR